MVTPAEVLATFKKDFKAGLVLYLECDFVKKVDPNKYILLACANPHPLYLVINSNPPPFTQESKEKLDCQVRIAVSEHAFFKHDSYVDCLQVYEIEQHIVERQIVRDPTRIKGRLNPDTIQNVLNAVQDSPSLEQRDQYWITNDLKPE